MSCAEAWSFPCSPARTELTRLGPKVPGVASAPWIRDENSKTIANSSIHKEVGNLTELRHMPVVSSSGVIADIFMAKDPYLGKGSNKVLR